MNVDAFTFGHQLPNGNNLGMGIVIRDHRGTIIKMYSKKIRNLTPRAFELWSILNGIRGSFSEKANMIEFESDSPDALKIWNTGGDF